MDLNALAVYLLCAGNCCLLLTGILCVAWLALSLQRSRLSSSIVMALTSYVVCALVVLSIHPTSVAQANALNSVADMDFELRICEIYGGSSPKQAFTESVKTRTTQDLRKTNALLDRLNFENSTLSAYHVVILHYLHSDCTKALDTLSQSEGKNGAALAEDLKVALHITPTSEQATSAHNRYVVPNEQAAKIAGDLKLKMPLMWFRDYALERLYCNSGQAALLNALRSDQQKRKDLLSQSLLLMGILPPLCFLAGAVIILILLVQLFRKKISIRTSSATLETIHEKNKHYSFKAVYGTIVAFLATKLAVRQFVDLSWFLNPHINASNALATTILLAAYYLLSNGSALFYAYIFAMRPKKVQFLEGISFRMHIGTTGPIHMLIIGALTCLPTMTIGFLASLLSTLCGLHGTSNPIQGFEVQIAQTGDLKSIISLYLQFLLLVPLIEESLIRGFLYNALRQRMNILYSVFVSSIFFSALHLDISGFLLIFTIGAMFALVVERTKSIVPTVFAHGIWLCVLFTHTVAAFR